MNMQDFDKKPETTGVVSDNKLLTSASAAIAAVALTMSSCKKEALTTFELNDVNLVGSSAEKDKQKSNAQFISILHTNLFQTAISSQSVFELDQAFRSVGDQEVAREVLISNFFNDEAVQLPTYEEMVADLDGFIENTYKRFLVRLPNEAEKSWVKNFIQNNSYMNPELVFFSFALCTEYQYY
jgi:hypothetical protein